MNIITDVSKHGRVLDGIATILKLDDETFEKVIEHLTPSGEHLEEIDFYYTTDSCRSPEREAQLGLEELTIDGKSVVRGYYASGSRASIQELFPKFEQLLKGFPEGSIQHTRLKRLLETRGLEAYKMHYVNNHPDADSAVVDKVFEILENKELFDKFIDFEHNKEAFEIEGVPNPKREICRTMERIFGERRSDYSLRGVEESKAGFYIPEMEECQERVLEAYKKINFARHTNGNYEFRSVLSGTEISRRGSEPEFEINPELREYVYNGMPDDLTLEEKVVYIYCKLCRTLQYNETMMYRNHMNNIQYQGEFSKEEMEAIKPGSKVVCTDFSRIFARFVNELPGDVDAVLLSKGEGRGLHFFVGVYTDKMSTIFDGTYAERGQSTDDLMKAKLGMPLQGIAPRYDEGMVVSKAVKKLYPMIIGGQPMRKQDYINQLQEIEKPEINQDDLAMRMEVGARIAKDKGLYGDELTQFFNAILKIDFFGPFIRSAYARMQDQDGDFVRYIFAVRQPIMEVEPGKTCVLNTKTAEVEELTSQEIREKFQGATWEDEIHTLDYLGIAKPNVGNGEKDAQNSPNGPEANQNNQGPRKVLRPGDDFGER